MLYVAQTGYTEHGHGLFVLEIVLYWDYLILSAIKIVCMCIVHAVCGLFRNEKKNKRFTEFICKGEIEIIFLPIILFILNSANMDREAYFWFTLVLDVFWEVSFWIFILKSPSHDVMSRWREFQSYWFNWPQFR